MVAVKKSLFGVFHVAAALGDVQQQVGDVSEHVSLLQTRVVARSTAGSVGAGMQVAQSSSGGGFCVPLENNGAYSTVRLDVGEPKQPLAVLVDTGSSAMVVASCKCRSCAGLDDCYDRTKSSTMVAGKFEEVEKSISSGNILAKVTTDVVILGAASVVMERSLFEMVDETLDTPLEGILGLGPPNPAREDDNEVEKSFMREAGVNHFSFCLRKTCRGSGGVLEVDGASGPAKKLANIGSHNWAVGLNGISVGDDVSSRLSLCSPSGLKSGQQTPCGAIPDSGTTMIAGPKSQITELMSGMCDAWPRCATAVSASPSKSKDMVFEEVLHGCKGWAEDFSFDEMPTLRFHLSGADGSEEPVEISPWAYVMEMHEALYQSHARSFSSLLGVQPETPLPFQAPPLRKAGFVCAPAFQAIEMNTKKNGPAWILGTSLFYDYVVHYDMQPQALSFVRGECGYCKSDGAGSASVQQSNGDCNCLSNGAGSAGVLLSSGDCDCKSNGAGSAGEQVFMATANGTGGRQAFRRLTTAPRLPQKYKRWHGLL